MKKIFFLTFAIFAFFSCEKDTSIKEETPQTENEFQYIDLNSLRESPIYKLILTLGFDESEIRISDKYLILQGDILFPLSYNKEISSKHWRTETLVSFENQTNIRVKIDNSIPPTSQWRTAINQAITNWNNIPDCRLNFSLVTSGQFDILIKSDDGVLEDYLCLCSWIPYPYYLPVAAAGTFPVGGKPGSEILINLTWKILMRALCP